MPLIVDMIERWTESRVVKGKVIAYTLPTFWKPKDHSLINLHVLYESNTKGWRAEIFAMTSSAHYAMYSTSATFSEAIFAISHLEDKFREVVIQNAARLLEDLS